ncbi:MAG: hypothetical protein ABIK78_06045 [candidate division WOR-3 bacterium]
MNFFLVFTLINGLILTEPPDLNKWKEFSFELEGNYYLEDTSKLGYLLSLYFGLPFSSEFSFDISYEEEWDFVLYYKKGFENPLFNSALKVGIDKSKNLLLIASLGKDFNILNSYGCGGFIYEKEEDNFSFLYGIALEKTFSNFTLAIEFYSEEEDKIITLGTSYSLPIFDIYAGIRRNFNNRSFIFNFGISKLFSF